MSGANKCKKVFICDCYPEGNAMDCSFRVSSYAKWGCDFQAAVGEHIALCNCAAANHAADIMKSNGHIAQHTQPATPEQSAQQAVG